MEKSVFACDGSWVKAPIYVPQTACYPLVPPKPLREPAAACAPPAQPGWCLCSVMGTGQAASTGACETDFQFQGESLTCSFQQRVLAPRQAMSLVYQCWTQVQVTGAGGARAW